MDLFSELSEPTERSQYGTIPVNRTVPAAAVPRVSRQCREILDRLHRGRASLRQLLAIATNHTARISELRQAGHDVRCVVHNYATGETWYGLFLDGREVGGEQG